MSEAAQSEGVANLVSMGFSEDQSFIAMMTCDNNIEQALELLLRGETLVSPASSSSSSSSSSSAAAASSTSEAVAAGAKAGGADAASSVQADTLLAAAAASAARGGESEVTNMRALIGACVMANSLIASGLCTPSAEGDVVREIEEGAVLQVDMSTKIERTPPDEEDAPTITVVQLADR